MDVRCYSNGDTKLNPGTASSGAKLSLSEVEAQCGALSADLHVIADAYAFCYSESSNPCAANGGAIRCTNTLPTDCNGLTGGTGGTFYVKPTGATGVLKVWCDGNDNVEIGGDDAFTSGENGGISTAENVCGTGGHPGFNYDYRSIAVSGQSQTQAYADLKLLVDSQAMCQQPFTFKCDGSIITDYQCVNSQSYKLAAFANSNNCDGNQDNVHQTDTGVLTSAVLPVQKLLPGDIGGTTEHNELVLHKLSCVRTLPTSCAGLTGTQYLKPSGANGPVKVTCLSSGGVRIGSGANAFTTGEHGGISTGEHPCGTGGHSGFDMDYTSVAAGGQTQSQIIADIKKVMNQHGTCSQPFKYHCDGSIITHYQCINGGGTGHKLAQYASSTSCDGNRDNVHLTDTGTFPEARLPIEKWLPGDIGGTSEHGELVLGELTCS